MNMAYYMPLKVKMSTFNKVGFWLLLLRYNGAICWLCSCLFGFVFGNLLLPNILYR